MLKKSFVLFLCLLSSLFISYMYFNADNHNLSAATNKYNVGGTVTGRVNMAPSGITGDHIGLQAGDHVMIGGDNPVSGNPLSFQLLLYDKNYTDYNNTDVINEVREPISAWYSSSDDPVGASFALSESEFTKIGLNTTNPVQRTYTIPLNKSSVNNARIVFEEHLLNNAEKTILNPVDLSYLRKFVNGQAGTSGIGTFSAGKECGLELLKQAKNYYTVLEVATRGSAMYGIPANSDKMKSFLSWKKPYHNFSAYKNFSGNTNTTAYSYFYSSGVGFSVQKTVTSLSSADSLYFRPFLFLNLSEVVFALSNENGSALRATVDDTFQVNDSTAYYTQGGSPMKLRMLDPNMEVTFEKIMNEKGKVITQIATGLPAYFNVSGTEGKNHTISALIFDFENHLIGYQPLDDAKADLSAYKFDTTGLEEGTYKIALVNEVYTGLDPDPTHSSALTDVKTLKITDPDFNVVPRDDLEYQKNVNQNDVVADIIVKDGVSYGSFELLSDTDETGHSNDYQLFEIVDKTITVKDVKGLNAGDYYFNLQVLDESGTPLSGVDPIPVCITVDRIDSKVAFDNPNQTKKSIAEAATSWNETATATPTTGVKVTYSVTKVLILFRLMRIPVLLLIKEIMRMAKLPSRQLRMMIQLQERIIIILLLLKKKSLSIKE